MRPVINGRGCVVVTFGRHKGEELGRLTDDYLQWMMATLQPGKCSIWGILAQKELHGRSGTSSTDAVDLEVVLKLWSEEDAHSYGILLTQVSSVGEGQKIVEDMRRKNLGGNTFLNNSVMGMYRRCGEPEKAVGFFLRLPKRNNYSWNIVMSAALQLDLDRSGERTKRVFDRMPMWDVVSRNVMMDAFAQGGKLDQAARLFEEACGDGGVDRVSWNTTIKAHSRPSTARRALQLFALMDSAGDYHPPDVYSLVSAFEACSSASPSSPPLFFRDFARALHAEVTVLEISDVAVGNSLVSMYGSWGESSSAKLVFDGLRGRDVVSWNAMLAALMNSEEMDPAVEAWNKMPCHNLVSWNAVIAVWSRRGDLAAALSLFFQRMPERNLVSWNAILSACVHNGDDELALGLWDRMPLKGDKITLTTLLSACTNLGLEARGASLLQNWDTEEPDVVVANAVLHFHVKCGNVSDAEAVFERIKSRRDVVSWSSMVGAVHHEVAAALQLLRLMQLEGVTPNKITGTSILSVCSHAGALDDGCSFFLSLEDDYATRPALDHYIAMIDLFGRAGNFDTAQELLHSMPFEGDHVAWRTLSFAYLMSRSIDMLST